MVEVILGDITKLAFHVDAIVNAANAQLIPGGGVDGAINRAAGPELGKAMAKFGGTPTGTAVITPAYNLNAEYVIHTVGPIYRDGKHGEEALLYSAYESVFALAHQQKIQSLATPIVSAGVYHYPKAEAAKILYEVATREENQAIQVTIVAFNENWLPIFAELEGK
ncbi:macro domain-containing protein [Enterococcus sp. AZ109]|uniref:macro domain-containing protein n=1 Tax=Enterococcus sp. AZ109 TaxID=2774634 RepID=UPI003F2292CE